jgi:hypothetical protein
MNRDKFTRFLSSSRISSISSDLHSHSFDDDDDEDYQEDEHSDSQTPLND